MIDESNLTENIIALIFYTAIAFFFFGLWLGWILWGSGGSRRINSAWDSGHSVMGTSIAPMLNPVDYSNLKKPKADSLTPVSQPVSAEPEVQAPKAAQKDVLNKAVLNKEAVTAAEDKHLASAGAAAGEGMNADVSAGKARLDDALGLVYTETPEQQDDLTALKGVGKVLNGKLNDFGIYTYRQIAGWTDSIVDEFSTRLSFKDRVKRDNWVSQAKQFHKEKYGEDIT